ncbi:nuclear transport factor 2 family protein [Microbacterium sp. SL75]|uniref:nuclear transport factor 2 family protein n=1 Tax=Microbacterium sp. SL75 TaxID=2995140 RepID=UPI00226FA70E|nr:nuclear transport factor 2 family protein [Microbacterium sp. SL75]WAC70116.1 nuclear transport factor 2 family protein [Microbacterium sp. SL75]
MLPSSHSRLVEAYLEALSSADIDAVLDLFTPDGVVSSPLYGERSARDFYLTLFADTAASTLTLRQILISPAAAAPTLAFWFDFDWTLADGTPAPFTVVDVAELDPDGRIRHLHIIYDTYPIRSLWDQQQRAGTAPTR